MKKTHLLILLLGWAPRSFAAGIPAPLGKFDCSLKKGLYEVEVSNFTGQALYLKVHHQLDSQDTFLEGPAMIVSHMDADPRKSFNLIRLPGSTVELYFDAQGRLGLDRGSMNCKQK